MDVSGMTVHDALTAMSTGKLTSETLTREMVGAIRRIDGTLNAYISVDETQAAEHAKAADLRRQKGDSGRLLGIPVAIKDNMNVEGQPCTCASRILEGYVSPYDSTAVARLRSEGAVFLGRTNMDEFAMGSTTENSAVGITRNPRNTDFVPGGSSGGAAAAVAGGEALAAIASDTGGSIRLPASFCGCVGLKPSYGRVSRYGLTAYASSLDQIGVLTKDVRDAALLLSVIAGHDEKDSTSVDIPVRDYTSTLDPGLSGLTVGIPSEYFVEGLDSVVRKCVKEAVHQCEALGVKVVDVSLPHTPYAVAAYYIIASAEASSNLARYDGVRYGFRAGDVEDVDDLYGRTRAKGFGAEVKRRIILGTYVLSSGYYDAYYGSAQKVRTLVRRDFEEAFRRCDALLCPVCPTAGYRIGETTADPLRMYLGDIYTVTANLAGICGLSVPCGLTGDGLPVGLQILGPDFGEEQILRIGHAYEQARGPMG